MQDQERKVRVRKPWPVLRLHHLHKLQHSSQNLLLLLSIFQRRFSSLSLPTTPSFSPIITTPRKPILFQTNSKLLLIPVAVAAVEDVTVDATEQLVSTTDDGVSVIVSILFFIAFIVLSVITIGVIYLAVTNFLIKREKDKFEKKKQ